MLRYTTDRARPGLVAVYDIRPGNGAGLFLQPRNPHGACVTKRRSAPLMPVCKILSNTRIPSVGHVIHDVFRATHRSQNKTTDLFSCIPGYSWVG